MDSYIVKVQHENSLRRLTLNRGDELVFSYAQLINKARDLFQFPSTTELVLTYVDKEGDFVTMAEDEDLKDALSLQSLNPLRVTLRIINKNPPIAAPIAVEGKAEAEQRQPQRQNSNAAMTQKAESSAHPGRSTTEVNEKTTSIAATPATESKGDPGVAENNESEQVLHHGFKCDGCGMTPIAGPRFRSNKKSNYDLCRSCFEGPAVDSNDFFKIEQPFHRFGHPFAGRMMRLSPAFSSRTPNSCPPIVAGVDSDRCSRRCPPVTAEKPGTDSRGAVHNGVACDSCGISPIAGPRFKSTTKFNYDLCLSCFEKSGSSVTGEYSRMDQPLTAADIHPLVLQRLIRLSSRYGHQGVWAFNPMIFNQNVHQSTAGNTQAKQAAQSDPKEVPLANKEPETAAQSDPKEVPLASKEPETAAAAEPASNLSETGDYFKQLSELEGATVPTPQVDAKSEKSTGSKVDTTAVEKQASTGTVAVEKQASTGTVAVEKQASTGTATVEKQASTGTAAVEKRAVPEDHGPVNNSGMEDLFTLEGLLAKLGVMGFTEQKLNEELLKKNKLDLRKTLDDLCAAEEWDPILEELQEMGFYDADVNRRLMFKNNGSVKRVVKELVQLSKDPSSKSGKEIKKD